MNALLDLLNTINQCNACNLIQKNRELNIPLIPFIAKPDARFVFIGRDPSPGSVNIVGNRNNKSAFIREIFQLISKANITEDRIYITDLCKCHWRTSRGTPVKGTENRSTKLPEDIAQICLNTWLVKELEILKPKVIICFGEELYEQMRPHINHSILPPLKLSATRDKSVMDAEKFIVDNGPFIIRIGNTESLLVPMRHPGNSNSLPKKDITDKRAEYYSLSKKSLIELLMQFND